MYWDYAGPTVIADTSSLTTRRPWYSMVYNDAVQGLALSPYGMTDASRYQVQHLAGQKQYELTNHLGNVQATISDLPVKVGEAHTECHAPALPAVYDYYPFGMLMPDRYTSDTSSECVTVSQTKWVTTWVTHCYLAADWVWPAYSYYGSVSVSTSSGLQIAAGESSGVYFEMDVLPYEQQDVYLQTDAFYSGSGTLELQEYHGGQWHMLGSTTFDKIGEVRISIRPREDRIRAVLRGPFYVQVKQFCVQRPQLSQETVLVDICDTDGDKYRFGWNGQEKVNEIAGVGNHTTAEFWEYDTRLGRRWNLDPVYRHHRSNYSAFGDNPILNVDINGDTENPIYDNVSGDFLGTDDKGIAGDAIKMSSSDFTQGMSHKDAMAKGNVVTSGGGNSFSEVVVNDKIMGHQKGLKSRPDYDGFVTINEGINWAKQHPGALQNPTPDNTLYVNSAKLDFGNISPSSFKKAGQPTPFNLNSLSNFIESTVGGNDKLAATVYALGRVNLMQMKAGGTAVKVVNDNATDYDWNTGGSSIRSGLIRAERMRTGLNGSHGFPVQYYGIGTLRPAPPVPSEVEQITNRTKGVGEF
jgi:hypothetical protein